MKGIKATAIQFTHAPGDKAFNWGRIRSFVREAAAQGVDLIVCPEMCITGYWHVRKLSRAEVESLAESVPAGLSTQELLTLAAANNMTIGAGLIEITDAGELFSHAWPKKGSGEKHPFWIPCTNPLAKEEILSNLRAFS